MASDNYEADSLIGKYVSACEKAEHSLDSIQVGLLEKTLNEAFGIKKNKSPPADVFKKIDMGILNKVGRNRGSGCGRIVNILKEYRENNLGITNDLPLTEADAWSLYSLTVNEIEETTYRDLKEKYNLSKTYGWSSLGMLHEYFVERGILDEDYRCPSPIDAH